MRKLSSEQLNKFELKDFADDEHKSIYKYLKTTKNFYDYLNKKLAHNSKDTDEANYLKWFTPNFIKHYKGDFSQFISSINFSLTVGQA